MEVVAAPRAESPSSSIRLRGPELSSLKSSIFVDEVMSQDLVRCAPQDAISRVEVLMRSKQIRRNPV
jgi:predicted transcriptional regulator